LEGPLQAILARAHALGDRAGRWRIGEARLVQPARRGRREDAVRIAARPALDGRRELGSTAQAGAVARPLALRGMAKEQTVARAGGPPARAYGPAVDPAGSRGDEEAPVEARVPRFRRPQALGGIEFLGHAPAPSTVPSVGPGATASRRKSTTSARVASGASRCGLCRLPGISRTRPRRTPRPMRWTCSRVPYWSASPWIASTGQVIAGRKDSMFQSANASESQTPVQPPNVASGSSW